MENNPVFILDFDEAHDMSGQEWNYDNCYSEKNHFNRFPVGIVGI